MKRWLRPALAGSLLFGGVSLASTIAESLPGSATAPTLYAAASAVGTGDCSTPVNACTLTAALSAVVAGGTIELVTPGTTVYSAVGGFAVGTALTSASLPVTIEPAPGVTNPTLDGGKSSTVLTVNTSTFLDISGVTIQKGSTAASCAGLDNNGGTLTVTDSTLSGNNAANFGGAICNNGGTTNVDDSTLTNNGASQGGAGIFTQDGTTNVTDSTLSDNDTAYFGGGIDNAGGTVNLTGSTLSGNSALHSGGGIFNDGTLNVGATIVANSPSGSDCGSDGGTLDDEGYNIDDDGSCGFVTGSGSVSDSSTLDASLGALQNNGGSTQTILPNAASPSPAVGVVPLSTTLPVVGQVCPTTDQRGFASAPGANCDIGAVQTASILYAAAPSALGLGDCADAADACTLPTALGEVGAGGTIELVTSATDSASGILATGTAYPGNLRVATTETSATSRVTIEPYGTTTPVLDGADNGTVLTVNSGVYLDVSSVTIQNSNGAFGGGIDNSGTLTVTDSTLSGNIADYGGGIFDHPGGMVTVTDSTLSGNSAPDAQGGGIFNQEGTVNVTDSTLSGNSATYGDGGGIFNLSGSLNVIDSTLSGNSSGTGGGIFNGGGTVTVTDSTLSGNSAGAAGGGINNDAGSVNVGATIVASSTSGSDCAGDTGNDEGYNIDDDGSCGFGTAPGSVSNSNTLDASLGSLQNNGGPTNTILPTSTSPAADQIPTGTNLNGVSVCPRTDQTGTSGPVAPQTDCTIGAVEARTVFYASAPSALGLGTCADAADACTLPTALSEVDAGGTIELITSATDNAIGDVTTGTAYPGNLTVATADTSATSPVTIEPYGTNTPILDGADNGTVLTVNSGVYLDVSSVTIQNGQSFHNFEGYAAGGGIFNDGTVTVTDSTLSGDSAQDFGGGIFNDGTVTVTDSTLSGDIAGSYGGGIDNDGTATVTDSTLSGDSAEDFGGGIENDGTATVTDSTLSGDSAYDYGAGIDNYNGTATVGATIVADSTAGGDCYGTITDEGYNIADDSSCGFTATGSVNSSTTLDASLGSLQNNGGPTDTIAPSSSSPAAGVIPDPITVNGVPVCGTGATDQRGYSRPLAGSTKCTIGAVEVAAGADLSAAVTDNLTGSTFNSTTNNTTGGSADAGATFTYGIVVANNGPAAANGASVVDTMPAGLSADTWSAAEANGATGSVGSGTGNIADSALDMPAGSTVTYTVSATVSLSASGSLVDTATVTPPSGLGDPNTANNSSTDTDGLSSLSVVKWSLSSGYSAAGQTINYRYLVINTGTTTLTSIGVSDNKVASVTCPQSSLASRAAETCTGSYSTVQADVDAGSVTNTAEAMATDPLGNNVTSASSPVTVDESGATSSLSLSKSTTTSAFSKAGQSIDYDYLVANTGTTTLAAISVSDNKVSTVSCPSSSLAPGVSETCTGFYTTTQTDVDNGSVTNVATAAGLPPTYYGTTTVSSNSSSVTVDATQGPAIGIVKSANVKNYKAPGVKVTYSYVVTNDGNVTLTKVAVTDPMSGLSQVSCPSATLAPSASETCTATYTTTQADVDRGWLKNTGTASGTSAQNATVTAKASWFIPAIQSPAITIVKSANVTSFKAPGTKVSYGYKVTNTGNVTLSPVVVFDPMERLSLLACPTTNLAPGVFETCTASYVTNQADVDRGWITNTGVAVGFFHNWPWATSSSTLTINANQSPALTISQSANPTSVTKAGTKVTFSAKVTTTGNVTLSPVTVTDSLAGLSKITCPSTWLAVGASETCTATYITTSADVTRGSIASTATATAYPRTEPR